MAIKKIYSFQNSASVVEDIRNPETGEVEGRCFIIIDNDTGDIYRYPMPVDVARQQGQKLMGIGGIEVANGNALSKLEKPGKG